VARGGKKRRSVKESQHDGGRRSCNQRKKRKDNATIGPGKIDGVIRGSRSTGGKDRVKASCCAWGNRKKGENKPLISCW